MILILQIIFRKIILILIINRFRNDFTQHCLFLLLLIPYSGDNPGGNGLSGKSAEELYIRVWTLDPQSAVVDIGVCFSDPIVFVHFGEP